MTTANNVIPLTGYAQEKPSFTVCFGKGEKGSPGDPVIFEHINDMADAIEARATVERFPADITLTAYKAKKARNGWLMRAIDEGTAYDEEKGAWHRRIGSVTTVDWLMFDFDKMPVGSYARMQSAVRSMPYPVILYKSTGYGLECKGGLEAFRLIVQCQPVAGEIAEAVSEWMRGNLERAFGGELDAACDQPTRVIYLPFKGEPVDVYNDEKPPFNCAACFEQQKLTLIKKGRTGLERGPELDAAVESFGPFADFVAWCLDNVPDAIVLRKPDGRIALQMPGQQPEKYSGGPDDGDGWNFYSPNGGYSMLVLHSMHTVTEPESTFKTSDAVRVLANLYGNKPAKLYASALPEAQASAAATEVSFGKPSVVNMPEPGLAPRSVVDPIAVYEKPKALKWLPDLEDERPEEPAADADEETVAQYKEDLASYEDAARRLRIERHAFFNSAFVLVANGSLVGDMTLPPSVQPLTLREWQIQQMPRFFISGRTAKGDPKASQYADAWLRSEKRVEVRDLGYMPGAPRIYERNGITWLNTFYIPPFAYTEDESLLKRFFWLVNRTHPIKKEADLFLNWLATKFRYPSFKAPFAHVNISRAFGTGRGSLVVAMKALFGSWNVESTSPKMILEDTYHDYAYGKLITIIEEGDQDSDNKRLRIDGVLRDMITADSKTLNLKYSGVKTDTPLYNSFAIFLNDYSLSINQGERRIQATTGAPEDTQPMTAEDNETLRSGFLKPGFRDQLASFLWRRDLSGYDAANADKTLPAFEILCENGGSFEERLAREIAADLPCSVVPAAYIEAQITRLLLKPENQGLSRQAIQRAIPAHRKGQKLHPFGRTGGGVKCHYFDAKMSSGYNEELRRGFSDDELQKYIK